LAHVPSASSEKRLTLRIIGGVHEVATDDYAVERAPKIERLDAANHCFSVGNCFQHISGRVYGSDPKACADEWMRYATGSGSEFKDSGSRWERRLDYDRLVASAQPSVQFNSAPILRYRPRPCGLVHY
jgi:hypothetical protein